MARKWLAGWKLFREEDPTTPTPTQAGASGGEIASPTSYEGDFQAPLVIPTPQSEQRQGDQEIQGSLVESSVIWVPSSDKYVERLRFGAWWVDNEDPAILYYFPGDDHTDRINNFPRGRLLFQQQTSGTDYARVSLGSSSGPGGTIPTASMAVRGGNSGNTIEPRVSFVIYPKTGGALAGSINFQEVDAAFVAGGKAIEMWGSVPIGCEALRNTAQLIATGTWTSITFNGESFDHPTSPLHDNATNPTRLTVPVDGRYHIIGQTSFVGSAATTIGARVLVNGTVVRQKNEDGSANSDMATVELYRELTASDYVEFQSFQNSGGNVNTETAAAELYPFLSVVRIS